MEAYMTEPESLAKQYNKPMKPTRKTDISLSVLFGPDADKIAEEFKIPAGFKRKEGWVLSKSRVKKIRKKYNIPFVRAKEEKSEQIDEKSVTL